MVRAVICKRRSFVASTRHLHPTPAIPRPWPQRRGVSQNSSPRPARPHPRSTEPSGLPPEVPSFQESALSLAVSPLAVKTALMNDGWRKKAGGLGACFTSFLPGNKRFEGIGDLLLLMP